VVFSGTPISSTNKTDRHQITEILLKMALSTVHHQIKSSDLFIIMIISLALAA
jgi:hypothetical protein